MDLKTEAEKIEGDAKAAIGSVESVLKVSENKFVAAIETYWPQICVIAGAFGFLCVVLTLMIKK